VVAFVLVAAGHFGAGVAEVPLHISPRSRRPSISSVASIGSFAGEGGILLPEAFHPQPFGKL
jgi:hypothetical protein